MTCPSLNLDLGTTYAFQRKGAMFRVTAASFCFTIIPVEELCDVYQDLGHDCHVGPR